MDSGGWWWRWWSVVSEQVRWMTVRHRYHSIPVLCPAVCTYIESDDTNAARPMGGTGIIRSSRQLNGCRIVVGLPRCTEKSNSAELRHTMVEECDRNWICPLGGQPANGQFYIFTACFRDVCLSVVLIAALINVTWKVETLLARYCRRNEPRIKISNFYLILSESR